MSKVMIRKYSLVAFGVLVAGCAAPSLKLEEPTGQTSADSIALQVMKADGRSAGLIDVTVDLSQTPASGNLATALDTALLREYLLDRATPLPGIPNAAMSAFFALELLNDQATLPRQGMWMPLWMPRSLAKTPLEAQLKLTDIVEQAIAEALPATYRLKPDEWVDKAVFGAESSYRILRVDGPSCEQWSCVIQGTLSSLSNPAASFSAKMTEARSAPFIRNAEGTYRSRGPAYVELAKIINEHDEYGQISGRWHRIKTEPLADFDYADFYQRLSASLPDWAYIYFGPEYPHNDAGVPYLLNRGNTLLFIKQQTDGG